VFSWASGNWAMLMFAIVGLVQMHMWAQGKKLNYRKTFGKE